MVTLRDYQNDSVNAVRSSLRSGKKRPLLVLPTGAGKTVCFSYIANSASLKGNSVMILVHRQELIFQTSDKLKSFGVEHGIISPQFQHTDHKVQIAMVQTLSRDKRLDKTERPDLLIIDECHHSNASNYQKVVDWADTTTLGVTATPCRLDGRGLGDIFDDICVGVTVKDLIDLGFLANYKYFGVPVKKDLVKNLRVKMGDYSHDTLKELTNGVVGDVVSTWEEKSGKQPTIVFCPSVESAERIAELFKASGYRFESLDGSMDSGYRKQLISSLADGKIDGITSCDVVSEGTDIPVAGCAVLIRKTKSTSLYLQQVGRVLRPVEGKTAVIIDMVQNYQEHGMPCDEREWTLETTKKRAKKDDDIQISFRQCEQCYACSPSNSVVCDECGEPFKIVKRKEMKFDQSFTLEEVTFSPKNIKLAVNKLNEWVVSKGWKKGRAWYIRKDWEALNKIGVTPDKATAEHWIQISEKSTGSQVGYNAKMYKEFTEWLEANPMCKGK